MNRFLRPFCFSILILSACAVQNAYPQQQEPAETEQSLLPEIDPQDIEIRSQFQARFPGLRRQPILGFNPRPRVFQTDPDRMPFIEDEEAILASLPIGELDRPEAPDYQPLGYADPSHLFFRGGIGSYISPEADLFAVAGLGAHNWISGNVNFHSSDGHEENVTTSFRKLDAEINSYNRISERADLQLSAGMVSNFNHMLQLKSSSQQILEADTRVDHTGFRANGHLDISETSLSGIAVFAGGYGNNFSLDSDLSALNGEAAEWGLNAGGEYSRLGNNPEEVHRLRVRTQIGGIDPVQGTMQNWSVSTASAHYERLFNYKTDVKAGLGISWVTDAARDYVLYAAPKVEIEHTLFRGLKVRALASGTPGHHTLADVQSMNRFFDLDSNLQHQYEMLALGELQTEPFYGTKILGGVSFQEIRNYLYYERDEIPRGIGGISEGYYAARFRDASILKIYGGFTQDLKPEVIWFSADGHWQIPNFSETETKIPFVETLALKASVSLRPTKELLIEGWGEFRSGREDHTGEKLDTYVLAGGKFEVSITENFGVYGKLLNLLSEEYEFWQGYQERGFQGYAGITYLF